MERGRECVSEGRGEGEEKEVRRVKRREEGKGGRERKI